MRNHSISSLTTSGFGHTDDPLDPDDVVAIRLRLEILQAATEVVFHSLAVLTQVRARFVQELLRHIHQVHGAEEGQEKTLGDAADSCAAVQGTAWSRLTFAFLGTGGIHRSTPGLKRSRTKQPKKDPRYFQLNH